MYLNYNGHRAVANVPQQFKSLLYPQAFGILSILRELLLRAHFEVVCVNGTISICSASGSTRSSKPRQSAHMMYMLLHHFRGKVRVERIESDRLGFVPSSPQFFVKALLLTDCSLSLLAKERPKGDINFIYMELRCGGCWAATGLGTVMTSLTAG
jgi:hypothetical protein